MKCRISGKETVEVFNLGKLYMSDFIEEGETPRAGLGELKMMLCKESGLLQLEKPIDVDKMYGKYWYRSGTNSTTKKKLQDVAESCVNSIQTEPGDVYLDIACNDGTLFHYVPDSFTKIGIDPADDSYVEQSSKVAEEIVQDFFSAEAFNKTKVAKKGKKAKIISAIAMFYDLDNPYSFLKDVTDIMHDDGLFVLQLSYTPLMINQLAFDNICHEHICYYSLSSLKYALENVGLDIVDCTLNDVNGGSFRVYMMKKEADKTKFRNQQQRDVADFRVQSLLKYEESLDLTNPEIYVNFYKQICDLKERTVSFIKKEKEKGKSIWGYGASTKGNTLLQWYGLNNEHIDKIAEKSEFKYGLKTVATNIPICSEKEMREAKPDYLLILPWHFIKEFSERESDFIKGGGKFIVPCPRFLVYPDEGL